MCEFCTRHGEGKKWYEIMEHYSREMLAAGGREAYIRRFVASVRQNAMPNLAKLAWAKTRLPTAYRFIRAIGTAEMKRNHYGQVVPVEAAEKILEMVHSITRIACICRSVTVGKNDARYCLLLGIDPAGLGSGWPELAASLETLNVARAKELLREFDRDGLVHSIWTFKTPFIGAICNCDRDCLAYKLQVSGDLLDVMFPAEFWAQIEPYVCAGCRACQKVCQFGAVEYSIADAKCVINTAKCYGCGVCRAACGKGAISLRERAPMPFGQFR